MLQPLHDYVLLKKEKEEKTTASGIILTSGKEKSKLAVVSKYWCRMLKMLDMLVEIKFYIKNIQEPQ